MPGHIGERQFSSQHEKRVADHYAEVTEGFYLTHWHPRHIHFGAFESGERLQWGAPETDGRLDQALERMIDVVIAPAGIGAGDVVVDAACGVGGTALYLARNRGCRVIALNICERQMEVGRALADEDRLGHLVEFRFSDCSAALCPPSESVDVVINIEAACHMSDRGRFLAECARILKPGGRLVAQDWLANANLSPARYREHIQPLCDAWSMCSLETKPGYVAKLRSAGLEIVQFVDLTDTTLTNAYLVRDRCRQLRGARFANALPESGVAWLERFEYLTRAWFAGQFQIHRYAARKPAGPSRRPESTGGCHR